MILAQHKPKLGFDSKARIGRMGIDTRGYLSRRPRFHILRPLLDYCRAASNDSREEISVRDKRGEKCTWQPDANYCSDHWSSLFNERQHTGPSYLAALVLHILNRTFWTKQIWVRWRFTCLLPRWTWTWILSRAHVACDPLDMAVVVCAKPYHKWLGSLWQSLHEGYANMHPCGMHCSGVCNVKKERNV